MGIVSCALLARDDSVLYFINWRTRVNTISLVRQHLTSVEPFPSVLSTSSVFMTQRSSLALAIKYIVVVRPYDLQLFTTFWPSSSLPRLLATFKFGWLFHLETVIIYSSALKKSLEGKFLRATDIIPHHKQV
jgi:hypothetical protein